MAADPSWQSEAPPPKKGLSVFGKVAIGCGAALLCFLLAIGAMAWVIVSKASRSLDRGWASIHAEIQSLHTDAGTRALYRDNPGLAQNFATEEDFLKAVREWRPKLGEIPEKRPDFKEMIKGRGPRSVVMRSHDAEGRKVVTVRMTMSTGATLAVEFEDEKLVDLQVD